MTSPELPPQLRVGARCLVGGKHRATVRYIGPVEGQSGEWAGLEWDDAARGKHDGSHGGRRYFACRGGLPAGSFVRLGKLLEVVSFGCSLLEGLERRYGGAAAGSGGAEGGAVAAAGAGDEELFIQAGKGRKVAVELVGAEALAERLADLGTLQKASCVDEGVSHLGSGGEEGALAARLPALSELDLSHNLIGDWAFVSALLQGLPGLQSLNLSGNRLELPAAALPLAPAPPVAVPVLPSLATLVLNGCGVSWPQAVALGQRLPGLRELRLCGNGISSLHLPAAGAAGAAEAGDAAQQEAMLAAAFSQLRVLDLEGNALAGWGEVQLLSRLPALQALQLGGNALACVRYSHGFTSLSTLLLGGNSISVLASLDELDRFPTLLDLRITDNPVVVALGGDARYEVIARVGRLTSLNGSEVSKMERRDAELNYLRHVTDALAACGGDEAARQRCLAANPRFGALSARYGTLAPSAPPPAAGTALARSLVEVVLCHSGKEVTKKLPVSLTVAKLKLMIEKLLRVKAARQALLLVPPPPAPPAAAAPAAVGASGGPSMGENHEDWEPEPEDITDEDARELRYFNLLDGTRVEVSESDPAARTEALRRAKQAAADLHQLRMQEQEKMIQQFRAVEQRLMTQS